MNEAKLGLLPWDMCNYDEKLERLRLVVRELLSPKVKGPQYPPERDFQELQANASKSLISSMLD